MADVNIPGIGPTPSRQVAIGGTVVAAAVVAWVWWRRKSAGAAAAVPAPTVDPSIDPATGLPYATEGAGTGAGFGIGGGGAGIFTNPVTGFSAPITNAQWTSQAVQALVNLGFDPVTTATYLGKYLAGACLSSTEADAVNAAIAYLGPPPVGSHPVTVCEPTPGPTPPPPPSPPPGGATGGYFPLSTSAALALIASGQPGYQSGGEALAWAQAHGGSAAGIDAGAFYPLAPPAAYALIASGQTLYQSQAEATGWATAHPAAPTMATRGRTFTTAGRPRP